jgi:putative endonuclease
MASVSYRIFCIGPLAQLVARPDGHREGDMGYLYIVQSKRNGRYYVGSTNNLDRRIAEHNFGKTKSLKNVLPVLLVFQKKFDTLAEARKMELKLKKMKSRVILDRIVSDGEIKMGL